MKANNRERRETAVMPHVSKIENDARTAIEGDRTA
jgi:hypothetical protein